MDVGCGLKGLSEVLLKNEYVGCDLYGGDIHCSAYALPFKDQCFETVVIAEVLEHLDMPGRAVEESTRVCRKRIVVTVPNNYSLVKLSRLFMGRDVEIEEDHLVSYNAWNLKQMFGKVGFETVESFCFPLRLQSLPELRVDSRFGYWLFFIAERKGRLRT